MAHEYDLRRGAVYMVVSALLFALMSVAVKVASATLPNVVVVFFRSGFGLLTLLPFIVGADLRTRRPREHLIRSLAGIASMYCFFYTLAHMRLADAVLLNYSLPIFIPFVESAWLGEDFPRRLWIPVAVGFLGVIVILRPGSGLMEPVALLGVASALFAAVAQGGEWGDAARRAPRLSGAGAPPPPPPAPPRGAARPPPPRAPLAPPPGPAVAAWPPSLRRAPLGARLPRRFAPHPAGRAPTEPV